jgi:hypothetical protein
LVVVFEGLRSKEKLMTANQRLKVVEHKNKSSLSKGVRKNINKLSLAAYQINIDDLNYLQVGLQKEDIKMLVYIV